MPPTVATPFESRAVESPSTQTVMPDAAISQLPPRVTPVLEEGKIWVQQEAEDQELMMWRQKAPLDLWLIDNSQLKGNTPGLGLRKTTELSNKDGQACIPWGSIVEARSCNTQWLETMTTKGVRFLPRYILGICVCTPYGTLDANAQSTPGVEERALPAPTSELIPVIVESAMAQTSPAEAVAETAPSNLSAPSYFPTSPRPAASDMTASPYFPKMNNYNVTVTGGIAALQGYPEVSRLYPEATSGLHAEQGSAPVLMSQEVEQQSNDETSKLFSTISGLFVGSIGVVCNTKTGLIREVMEGQARKVGVRPGWTIKQIDGQPYNDEAMVKIIESKKPYQVTFEVPLTNLQVPISAPEPIAYEPPHTYSAGYALPPTLYTSAAGSLPPTVMSPSSGSFPQTTFAADYGGMSPGTTLPASPDTHFAALQYSPSYREIHPGHYSSTRNISREEMLGAGYLVQDWSGSPQRYEAEGPILPMQGAPSPISQTQPISAFGATSPLEEAPSLPVQGAPSPISQTQGEISLDFLGQTRDAVDRPNIWP